MNKYQKILKKRARRYKKYLKEHNCIVPFRFARNCERLASSIYFDLKKEGQDVTNFIYDNIYK